MLGVRSALVAIPNDQGMLDIRNKAAHDEVLSRDEAQQRGHGQCKYWSKYSACVLYVRLWRQKDKSMAKQYVEQRENVSDFSVV